MCGTTVGDVVRPGDQAYGLFTNTPPCHGIMIVSKTAIRQPRNEARSGGLGYTPRSRPDADERPATFCAAELAAQSPAPYPQRNVQIVVPYTPGTGARHRCAHARARLAERWKVGVITDNRPARPAHRDRFRRKSGAGWPVAAYDGDIVRDSPALTRSFRSIRSGASRRSCRSPRAS